MRGCRRIWRLLSPLPLLRGSYSTGSPGRCRDGSVLSNLFMSAVRPPSQERIQQYPSYAFRRTWRIRSQRYEGEGHVLRAPMLGIINVRRGSQDGDVQGVFGKAELPRSKSPAALTSSGRASSPLLPNGSSMSSTMLSFEPELSAEVHQQRELNQGLEALSRGCPILRLVRHLGEHHGRHRSERCYLISRFVSTLCRMPVSSHANARVTAYM